jgi:hypothetical protein
MLAVILQLKQFAQLLDNSQNLRGNLRQHLIRCTLTQVGLLRAICISIDYCYDTHNFKNINNNEK